MDDWVETSGGGTLKVPIHGWEDGAVYEAGHNEVSTIIRIGYHSDRNGRDS